MHATVFSLRVTHAAIQMYQSLSVYTAIHFIISFLCIYNHLLCLHCIFLVSISTQCVISSIVGETGQVMRNPRFTLTHFSLYVWIEMTGNQLQNNTTVAHCLQMSLLFRGDPSNKICHQFFSPLWLTFQQYFLSNPLPSPFLQWHTPSPSIPPSVSFFHLISYQYFYTGTEAGSWMSFWTWHCTMRNKLDW